MSELDNINYEPNKSIKKCLIKGEVFGLMTRKH